MSSSAAAPPAGAPEHNAPAALIFDCDGTIVDTMKMFYEVDRIAAERHGLKLTRKRFYELAGVPIMDIFALLGKEQGVETDVPAIMGSMAAAKEECTVPVTLIEPVAAVVREWHGRVPLAVASSGQKAAVLGHLGEHGMLQYFDAVVTVEDVPAGRGKPAPDLYLEAARRLGVDPSGCVAYEDADLGIESVKAAGMTPVDVRLMEGYPHDDYYAE
mmetsp:Transcript_19311/g.65630  ORF Transcript_19311/g.65630 Transcript_19311/m.65630 type:complete len:215 (+) Transcript_19311:116-760(+)|eukprot:CAMPEP_0183798740 /NCGR_PEP_ID=MMETSP0803_2-20130417/19654_1 /TAXON_ID=195967 /ORGANISM="Crustomastix stigmata, Strain CCMP3273" /LENGTH=214 /DNA_ID=CAMNT_0026043429 /DNA_START=45 /DNA_END=689 /DNA_ORIENTATION=+